MSGRFSRRHLLLWTAASSASALLAACGAAAPPAPTAAPAKTESKPAAATSGSAPTTAAAPASAPTAAAASAPTTAPATGAAPAAKPAAGKQGQTVRLHMRSGGEKSEPAIYVDRPAEWEQETGNTLKLEPIPGGKDYIPKVDSLAASNTIGDSLWTSDVWAEHTHLVKFNIIEPVDSYLPKYNVKRDEWFKAITDTLTYNGKMYGLPKTGHPGDSYVWVNLKMFDQAGIKRPDTFGATFDQVRDWANKLAKGPKDRREVYGYYSSVTGLQGFTNGVRQFGGDLVDKEGTKSLVDQPEFFDWLTWNSNLLIEDKVHPLADAVTQGDAAALAAMFAANKLAMIHQQRSTHFQVRNAVKDAFEWAAIQFPRGPKAKGWGTSIDTHSGTATSKVKDEAFTLIQALSDRRFAYLVGKTQGYLTGRVDNLEALKEVAQDPFIQLQQKCTEQNEPFWRAKNLRHYEFEAELKNQLDLIWLGKAKADKAFVGSLKTALDAILAKPE